MRFFTRGWAGGELDDQDYDRVLAAYWQRIAELGPRLPPAMRDLSRTSLHDALLERVRWDPARKRLVVTFVAEGADGALTVTATYAGAMLGMERIAALRNAALDREATVLYDEVDVDDDGTLAHRLLFWPREEVTIDFVTLQLEVAPRADFRVVLGPAFLEVEPDDEGRPAVSG